MIKVDAVSLRSSVKQTIVKPMKNKSIPNVLSEKAKKSLNAPRAIELSGLRTLKVTKGYSEGYCDGSLDPCGAIP